MSVETQEQPKTQTGAPVGGGVVPCTVVPDAREAARFYAKAFGGVVQNMMPPESEGGKVMHCHMLVNGGSLIFNDAFPEHGFPYLPPQSYVLHLQVDDPKAWWQRAVDAGCTVTMPLDVQFWGDRYGQVKDPFDIVWSIGGKP
jgi:PhnB protein